MVVVFSVVVQIARYICCGQYSIRMPVNFDPVAHDLVPDRTYPAALTHVTFESKGNRLIGVMFQAQGKGPHPAIVLLHGFPGYERNLDLAHIFRRAGWNVLVFHYRGAWSSQGRFSFTHVLEDVGEALTFLRTDDSCELYRSDPHRIVVVGHSLGGFAALMTAASDPCVGSAASIAGVNIGYFAQSIRGNASAVEEAVRFFEESLLPLRGTSSKELLHEAFANAESWNLLNYVDLLSECSLLLIGGSRDQTAPVSMHHHPLVNALGTSKNLTDIVLDADHSFSDKRVTLARTLLLWLEQHK
jgi:pimeloyl-ACP methyl ester carboxylesterase